MPELTDTLRFASALSTEDDAAEATAELIEAARDDLGEGPVDLALLFASAHYTHAFGAMAAMVEAELEPRVALGLTAAGVIGAGAERQHAAGVSLLLGRLQGATLHPFRYDDLDWPASADDPAALRRAVTGSADASDVSAVLLFVDPFAMPMVKFMPALNEALPGVPVIGGLASAANQPGENRLLLGDDPAAQGAVGVAIGGDLRVESIVSQGCRPIGRSWVITQARHNIIQQLGGRPAMQVVQETAEALPPEDQSLLRAGLFVGRVIDEYKDRFGRGDFLIRNIIGADQNNGYIAIGDLVRAGQTIQFHVRDGRTAEEDLRLLLAAHQLDDPPAAALLCNCNGRGTHMFREPNAETTIIRDCLGDIPLAGFFAAGEIGPIGGQNFLHGFTASLAVFRSGRCAPDDGE